MINSLHVEHYKKRSVQFELKIKKRATNSEYTKKISSIKNDKIKNSLLEMSKYFKKI